MKMPVNSQFIINKKQKTYASVSAFSQAKLEIAVKSLEKVDLSIIRKKKA